MPTPPRRVEFEGREYWVNGCTGVPNGDWLDCCDRHDIAYVAGGSWWQRLKADTRLGCCIVWIGWRRGWLWVLPYVLIGLVYFVGVRLFGFMLWRWWWCK